MMQTFLGGDMVLYAFMVLAANIMQRFIVPAHEEHRRTRHFKEELLFIYGLYYFRRIHPGDAGAFHFMGIFAMSKYGMGTLEYPAYFALSIVAKILFVMAHISFAVTMLF